MSDFKKGDVVRLKSGGCEMTIEQIGYAMAPDQVKCSWFDDNKKFKTKFIAVEALEKIG